MPFAVLTAVFLLLQSVPISAQPTPLKGTIQGLVTAIVTNEPIAGAQVVLTRLNPPAQPGASAPATAAIAGLPTIPPVTSSGDGRFEIGNLDAGVYRLAVMNNGYVREEYPQWVNGVSTTSITLSAGQAVKDLTIRMTKAGNISGRIRNATGAPVAGVTVELLRPTYSSTGTRSFEPAGTAQTNDLGEYRLYWVTPGRYQIKAGGGGGSVGIGNDADAFDQSAMRGNNSLRANYSLTFFPGVPTPERAETVDIRSGVDITGIDFAISRQRLYRIRARVVDSRTGQAPPQASVTLSGQPRPGVTQNSSSARFYNASKGIIEIDDLFPGTYGLRVTAQTAQASAVVVIRDTDIEDVVLTIAAPPVIAGRLQVEGQLPEGTKLESLRVQLRPLESAILALLGGTISSSAPTPEGTFTINGASNGEFRVTANIPAGAFIKEARLDGVDVLSRPASFSRSGDLVVVISSKVGRVQGRVTDERTQFIAGIQVVLVPDSVRERYELFKTGTSDAAGFFTISGIAPGGYKLFAWENIEPFSYMDSEVLKKFEAGGKVVQVGESSDQTLELRAIPTGVSR